jgi:hypothetical protein
MLNKNIMGASPEATNKYSYFFTQEKDICIRKYVEQCC